MNRTNGRIDERVVVRSEKTTVLVADDEKIITSVLEEELTQAGYAVDVAFDGEEAYGKLKEKNYDVAVFDVRMPKRDGLSLLKEVKSVVPETVVILMTAFGTINNAVEAMKIGAYDYVTKPFENDELLSKIRQALMLRGKNVAKQAVPDDVSARLIGASKEIERLKANIQKVKNLDSTVLLIGESGTGKGVVARELHSASARRDLPFIHVNCAALPSNLMESELFGHEKGAFTGAVENKKGKFELAGKGTLFLDEIGTLEPKLQAKLLIALQERRVERVGSNKPIPVEARIIAATNSDLEEAVRRKEFREDLFYRLNVITIECPPLRYRKEDIKLLALSFIDRFNAKLQKNITSVAPAVWRMFASYDWPGNVRELENTIESAIALSNGGSMNEEDLPLRIIIKVNNHIDKDEGILKSQEIEAIKNALKKFDGHREKAAKELGISKRTLQYKLNKFELRD